MPPSVSAHRPTYSPKLRAPHPEGTQPTARSRPSRRLRRMSLECQSHHGGRKDGGLLLKNGRNGRPRLRRSKRKNFRRLCAAAGLKEAQKAAPEDVVKLQEPDRRDPSPPRFICWKS